MEKRWTIIRAVGTILALGLFVVGCASTRVMNTRLAEPKAEPAVSGGKTTTGPAEGLKVHGHWTIEVRNPDNSLVEHREFENALVIGEGDVMLGTLLYRGISVGDWRVQVTGLTLQICEDGGGTATDCYVVESTDPQTGPNSFHNLTRAQPSLGTMRLSGYVIAQRDGQIDQVSCFDRVCLPSIAPQDCPGNVVASLSLFTRTGLGAPVAVLTGQQVLVNVTFSFS